MKKNCQKYTQIKLKKLLRTKFTILGNITTKIHVGMSKNCHRMQKSIKLIENRIKIQDDKIH